MDFPLCVRLGVTSMQRLPQGARQRITRRGQLVLLATPVGALAAACGAAGPANDARLDRTKQPVSVIFYNNLVSTHPETVARIANLTQFNASAGQELGIVVDTSNAAAGAGGDQHGG